MSGDISQDEAEEIVSEVVIEKGDTLSTVLKKQNLSNSEIQSLINEYKECSGVEKNTKPKTLIEAKQSKENYYYWIRSEYNKLCLTDKKDILGSAMFIFLNKTCFRGIFRIGPNGFNVPYGHYKNPEIINKNHLDNINLLIKDVIFKFWFFIDIEGNKTEDFGQKV